MSMQDPVSDMLAQIKNALAVDKMSVTMPSSKLKVAIMSLLKDEGYISDFSEQKDGVKGALTVDLKYYQGEPVIAELNRISKPSLRVYRGKDDLPRVNNGLGVAVISTPKGVMSDRSAREAGLGGEVLCYVS